MSRKVYITEVCPRDGWQNHQVVIPTETKTAYIKRMIDYGAAKIDATSFVNPKYVPQMFDSDVIITEIMPYAAQKGIELSALTLNRKGVERAAALGLKNIQFVLSASEEHNMRNSRRTIAESLTELMNLREAVEPDTNISLALACVFHSPFGDKIDLGKLKEIIRLGMDAGISEFGLGETDGQSDPVNTGKILDELCAEFDPSMFSAHIHNTQGMALANMIPVLEHGIVRIDSALAGMGGCPFAPGAKGNVATEDLVNLLEKMGWSTGIDLDTAVMTSRDMCADIQAEQNSCYTLASSCGK